MQSNQKLDPYFLDAFNKASSHFEEIQSFFKSQAHDGNFEQFVKSMLDKKENSEEIVPFKQSINQTPSRKPLRMYMDGCFDLIHSGHYNALR